MDSPSTSGRLDSTAPVPITGRALLLLILKEGVLEACKFFARIVLASLRSLQAVGKLCYTHKHALLRPVSRAPANLKALFQWLWASRLGKAVIAAVASLIYVKLKCNTSTSTADGDKEGVKVTLKTELSLLMGTVRFSNEFALRLGSPSVPSVASPVNGPTALAHPAAASRPDCEELRLICPQAMTEHIRQFLESQSAASCTATPARAIQIYSPQKSEAPTYLTPTPTKFHQPAPRPASDTDPGTPDAEQSAWPHTLAPAAPGGCSSSSNLAPDSIWHTCCSLEPAASNLCCGSNHVMEEASAPPEKVPVHYYPSAPALPSFSPLHPHMLSYASVASHPTGPAATAANTVASSGASGTAARLALSYAQRISQLRSPGGDMPAASASACAAGW